MPMVSVFSSMRGIDLIKSPVNGDLVKFFCIVLKNI